jgi:hypothetical protein
MTCRVEGFPGFVEPSSRLVIPRSFVALSSHLVIPRSFVPLSSRLVIPRSFVPPGDEESAGAGAEIADSSGPVQRESSE